MNNEIIHPPITHQHTYVFPITGESVTVYISDTSDSFRWCLSLTHEETADTLEGKWYMLYEGICQIHSKVNPLIWYMYLTAFYECGRKRIPTERVVMVCDCNYKHEQH